MSGTQWAKNVSSGETTKVGVFASAPAADVSVNEILLSFMDIIPDKGYRHVCHDANCPNIIMSNHIARLSDEDIEIVEKAVARSYYATIRLMDGSEVEVYKEVV
ncbi:hypothetical protein D3C78_1782660 [compost metagenome]